MRKYGCGRQSKGDHRTVTDALDKKKRLKEPRQGSVRVTREREEARESERNRQRESERSRQREENRECETARQRNSGRWRTARGREAWSM